MGVLYEGVAVDFWTGIVARARAEQAAAPGRVTNRGGESTLIA